MTSTLKKLKNERELLTAYANELGIQAEQWEDIASQIVITEDARAKRSDGSEISVIPAVCLDRNAERTKQLAQALLQPDTSTVGSRVFFAKNFARLMELWRQKSFAALRERWREDGYWRAPPMLYKGVSYPSSLQRTKSEAVLEADNPWLIDLFAFGVQYCKFIGDPKAYQVVDTSNYELWNRLTDKESAYILGQKKAKLAERIVQRFIEVGEDTKYAYLRENVRRRKNYLDAIARIVGLPNVTSMRRQIIAEPFTSALDEILQKAEKEELFCYEGATKARNFAPFVYAEEALLREREGISACIGPIKEDLPLNLKVLQLSKAAGKTPMPVFWYTRPTTFPPLTIDASEKAVKDALSGDVIAARFAQENLLKLDRLPSEKTVDAIANEWYKLMRDVKCEYERQ